MYYISSRMPNRVRYAQSAENYIRAAKLKEEQKKRRNIEEEEEQRRLNALPQRNYWNWAKKAAAKDAALHGIYSRLKKIQEEKNDAKKEKEFNNMNDKNDRSPLRLRNDRGYFGGKRTRKNKSKKRSKSRKN